MNEVTKSPPNLPDVSNLSPREALALEAKILGYRKMPVTIRRFIDDPYYLGQTWKGHLYDYWYDVLEKIFPDEIHLAYTFVVFTGRVNKGPIVQ